MADLWVIPPALPTMPLPPSTRLMMWDRADITRSTNPPRLLMPTEAVTTTVWTQIS